MNDTARGTVPNGHLVKEWQRNVPGLCFWWEPNRISVLKREALAMRHFPEPWTVEAMPTGYRVIDANGICWRMSMASWMMQSPYPTAG